MRVLVFDAGPVDMAISSMATALERRHEVESFPYNKYVVPVHARATSFDNVRRAAGVVLGGVTRAMGQERTVLADRALLRHAKDRRYDLILVLRIHQMPARVLGELKRATGALLVGWFMDAIVNVGDARFIDAPFDHVFFKDKVIVSRFRDGLASDRYEFLPDGFNPENHRPVDIPAEAQANAPDVVTYGNGYGYRAKVMEELLAAPDLSVRIHGTVRRGTAKALRTHYAPRVFARDKSIAVRAAKVALNTNHFGEIAGVNKRTFEMAGAGAFQLTDGPAVAEYFEPGREVATFRGPRELVEHVRHYAARPDERRAIAEAGLARAWREHTYHHRLNHMFSMIPSLRGERPLPVPAHPPAPRDESVAFRDA